jgi:hypothetical protein
VCIDAADLVLADKIWSHAPEVIFIDPRGTERGLQEVKDTFIRKTMDETFSTQELTLETWRQGAAACAGRRGPR